MKKSKLFLLLGLSMLLFGCNTNPSSNISSTSSNISSSSLETSITSDDSSSSISNNSEIKKDEMYHSLSWDQNLLNVIACITGSEKTGEIPIASATEYYYYFTVDEASGLDLVVINCQGINEKTVVENYELALEHASYTLSYDNPYGYKEFSDTEDLVVQYGLTTSNNQTYFELLIYMTEFRVKDWPEATIKAYMGETIPSLEARSYEVYQDYTIDYKVRLNINAYHVSINSESEYSAILTKEGFVITTSANANYYEAVNQEGNLHVQYTLFEDTLSIYVYNDYPYALVYSTLGFDLPRVEEENVIFDYAYIEVSQDEYVLTLYYDNSSSNALATYGEELTKLGFIQVGEEKNYVTDSNLNITERNYIYQENTENEHYVTIMYESTTKSLAIAIYY